MKPFISLFLFFCWTISIAQTELPTGKIEVVKDFEVRLADAKKIRVTPQPLMIDTMGRTFEYRLLAPSPSFEYAVPALKPLSLEPEQKPNYYPLYAKAGYGSPNSLLGLLSYEHLATESFDWGFDFRHLSANNKKIALQKFSTSEGRINASYLTGSSMLLDGYVDGKFETVYFYGSDDIPVNPEALKRRFNRYDLNLELSNTPVENAYARYKATARYIFDKDDLGSRERTIQLGGDGQVFLGEQNHPLGFKVLADLTHLEDIEEKTINNILAGPYFIFSKGDLNIRLGGLALLKKNENEILPAMELSYTVSPLLSLYAEWEGDVFKNNFHSIGVYNPYINIRLDSINNQITRRITGGIRGVKGIVTYDASGTYAKFQNMAFFLQDPGSEEQFTPIYNNGSYVEVKGSVTFEALKHVMLRGNAYSRFYSLEDEEKPWHKPSFGADALATYTGGDDIYHLSLIFHGENGLPYKTPGGTITNLDPLLDLNLHGDYYFTQSFGAFLELNNLFGNNRERWAGYPSFGFNVKAGLMLRL